MKKSQRERIITKLLRDGYVTRNEALSVYISRLGAIICVLQKEGWTFYAHNEKKNGGIDYIYEMTRCPFKKVTYQVPGLGKTIIKYEREAIHE